MVVLQYDAGADSKLVCLHPCLQELSEERPVRMHGILCLSLLTHLDRLFVWGNNGSRYMCQITPYIAYKDGERRSNVRVFVRQLGSCMFCKGTRHVRKYSREEYEKNRKKAERLEKKADTREFNAFISLKSNNLLQRGKHVCTRILSPFPALSER